VPRFPAIYDEDLYDAFEYTGLQYLQIKFNQGPWRRLLTYDTFTVMAGHNLSLCADPVEANACHDHGSMEDIDIYYLVTLTKADLLVSSKVAHGYDLL
jgi:hypothetical protein